MQNKSICYSLVTFLIVLMTFNLNANSNDNVDKSISATHEDSSILSVDEVLSDLYMAYELADCKNEKRYLDSYRALKSKTQSASSGFGSDSRAMLESCDECPDLSFASLQGVLGYPQVSELSLCGVPDTVSLLMYNAGDCPLTNLTLTVNFDSGLAYGGFVEEFNGKTVSEFNVSDASNPQFLITSVDSAEVFILNFAISADCDVDFNSQDPLNFDVTYDYSYENTATGTAMCNGVEPEIGNFNNGLKVPVLNVLSISPVTRTITASGTDGCQQIVIRQDGLGAKLGNFDFDVCGVTDEYMISQFRAKSPDTDIPYTIDPNTGIVSGSIDATQIANIGNGDDVMDPNESITIEVCYQVMGCVEEPMVLDYKATYGCNGKKCGDASIIEGAVQFMPNYGATPVAVSSNITYGGICGADLSYDVSIASANTDPIDGMWQDLRIKYAACLGNGLTVSSVMVNGQALDASLWSTTGATLELDFTANTDAAYGLQDFDGDGLMNDLPGGESLDISTIIDIGCSDTMTACDGDLACNLTQVEVIGKRNCGEDFQQFAPLSEPVTFFYGELSSSDNTMIIPGYGLPITEVFSTTPNVWMTGTVPFQYGYEFGFDNITPCASPGGIKLVVNVVAAGNRINNIRYTDGTAMYQGAPVAGVTADWITIDIGGGATDTIGYQIEIPAGDETATLHDYEFYLDYLGDCFPNDYAYITYKVVEECNGCGDTDPCEIVRSCGDAAVYVIWNGVSCPCIMEGETAEYYRTNYGYADKEMTVKLTRDDVPEADQIRFLPGDTLFRSTEFTINDIDEFKKADYQWLMRFDMNNPSPATPLIGDINNAQFLGWFWYDSATDTKIEIGVPDCMQAYTHSVRDNYIMPSIQLENFGVEGYGLSYGQAAPGGADNNYGVCDSDPNLNPNYPGNIVHYDMQNASAIDYFTDQSRMTVYWQRPANCPLAGSTATTRDALPSEDHVNPCFEEFFQQFPMQAGDKIVVEYQVPMIHNPAFDLQALNGTSFASAPNLYIDFIGYTWDENSCSSSTIFSDCSQSAPLQEHIPGPVSISNTVVVEDCDTQVDYVFTLENPVPTDLAAGELPWFENEYRPYMATEYLQFQFPNNMIYLGDGVIVMPDGSEVTFPAEYIQDSEGNLACVDDGAGGVCCVAANTDTLAAMKLVDEQYLEGTSLAYGYGPDGPNETGDYCDIPQLIHHKGDPFPHLMVGGTETCTYGIRYSLASLCPEEIESTDFRLEYQFAEPYIPTLARERQNSYFGNSSTATRDYTNTSYLYMFPINPFGEGCSADPLEGCSSYFQKITTDPNASNYAVNPMRDGGYLITTPDNFTDNSMNLPTLVPNASALQILIADLADMQETNTYEVCAPDNGVDLGSHTNVATVITVPLSIDLLGVEDENGAAQTFTLVSTTATHRSYTVSNPDLAPGECFTMNILTELLFCPVGLDVDTEICLTTTSGCIDGEKAAALAAAGGNACSEVGLCYMYIADEADLQAEWLPDALGEIPLCSVVELETVVKNVKPANLIDLETMWWLPAGLEFIPGSWQVCYPGGPNVTGPCVSIPDPTPDAAQNSAYGTYYEYLDDQIWSSQIAGDPINTNGLPGSLSAMDSNFVKFVFEVETVCDDFISGTSAWFQADAADPCENRVESMFVPSPPIIVEGANPADFAQFFVFADPVEASCGSESFITLTYLNTSALGVTDNSMVCMDIETSTFNYMPGSITMVSPATYSPTFTESTNGSITHICFDIPDGIGPGQVFQTGFAFSVPEDLACGEQDLGVVVSSELMSQNCMAQGIECSVGVLNSVNPIIEIDFLPPVTVGSQDLRLGCSTSPGMVEACYDVELVNNGATYNNDVTVALIYDVDQNGQIDDYDTKLNEEMTPVLITSGDTIMISGCLEIPADQSCPVFLMIMQETNCVCDAQDFYYDSLQPDLGLDGRTAFGVCPGEPFGMEYCGDFTYTLVPASGGTVTTTADSLYVELNGSTVTLNVTGDVGQCDPFDYNVTINNLMDFEIGPYATVEACSNSCTVLNAGIPIEYMPNITVEWVPSTYLDDPTSLTPMMCNPTSDITYTVVATFTDGDATCVFNSDMPVVVSDPVTNDIFTDLFFCQMDGPIEAPAGKDNYFWYLVNDDGTSTVAAVGETFMPTEAGTYYLDCFSSDDVCHTYSNEFSIQPCVDLALTKTINQTTPGPYGLGSTVTFDVTVYNQSPTIDMFNVYIKDYFPECLVLTDPNWSLTTPASGAANGEAVIISPIAFIPANGQQTRTITFMISPTCDTSMPIYNNAEISAYDDDNDPMTPPLPDEDSVPDDNSMTPAEVDTDDNYDDENPNMPGSEDDPNDSDDYDLASVEIFDLALMKVLDTPAPWAYGDELTFTINVINQGNVPATDIVVTDYLPSGYAYVSGTPAWTANGSNIETTIAGPLAPGATMPLTVVLEMLSDNSDGETSWINEAEISAANDADGNPAVDQDSTPDNDPTNDAGGVVFSDSDDVVDGDGTGTPDDEVAATDEDDADPAGIEIVDIALTKMPVTTGPFAYGDIVEFEIEVSNQGSVTLTDVEITDYIPCGYEYVASNSPTWTYDATGRTAVTTIAGPMTAGATMSVNILLEVIPCTDASGDAYTNVAEVSSMSDDEGNDVSNDDIDSTSDNDPGNDPGGEPNGTTDDVTDGTDGDEDDSDPAIIEVFDLALIKTVADPGPYAWLDDITYDITVTNQGNVDADNIEITDYFPSCFTLNDAAWTDNMNSTATRTLTVAGGDLAAPLAPAESVTVQITLTVGACGTQTQVNYAEISDATDGEGGAQTDADSTPDDTNGNDAGGNPDSDSDDVIDGDGTGTPDDEVAGTDEDDHDPEPVLVEVPVWDLALIKTLTLGQPNPVSVGDVVSFDVQVTNQGNQAADNITITDQLPDCMTLTDTDWTNNGDGTADIALSVANGGLTVPLPPGQSVLVDIVFTVDECATGTLMNWAEISDFTDEFGDDQEDVDSTPDADPDNDLFTSDDDITQDGANGGDEDDHDPADITILDPENMIFDLALTKTLSPGQASTVGNGATVSFDVTVINQGNISADNIEVVDYMPDCFMLADANWTDNNDGSASIVLSVANGGLSTPLQPNTQVIVPITVVLMDCAPGDLTNYAEIADATDDEGNPQEDEDSTPDSDPNNDAEGDDNQTDGDGNDDEDDHDPEVITLDDNIPMDFDLALTKVLSPGQIVPVENGDMVNFEIEVFNQGDLSADNIEVVDYIPSCMSLADADWSDNMNGSASITLSVANGGLATPLLPGTSVTVEITLSVDSCTDGTTITNWSEIAGATDGAGNPQTDVDSTPDSDPDNDNYMTDNDTSGDGTNDEDDHDPAEVPIGTPEPQEFDLALVKSLAFGQSSIVMPGDLVDYEIFVINQGNVPADNVELVDYIPDCFTLADVDWTDNGDGSASITVSVANGGLTTPILPGESVAVELTLEVGSCDGTTQTNWAEIAGATDGNGNPQTDVDSTPDSDPDNDSFGDDDQTDGNGTDDEDDHDPEEVTVQDQIEDFFDLALTKTLLPGASNMIPVNSSVTYNVNVQNQGTIEADNIELVDYLPACASLVPGDWTDNGDGTASIILSVANGGLSYPLPPGETLIVPISLDYTGCPTGSHVNWAEIADATDGAGEPQTDIDSTPDGDQGNDTYGNDNQTDGDGSDDEDDHDPEEIIISPALDADFDLALEKQLAPGQSSNVANGDIVVYEITVYNQGNVPADDIEVVDYLPTCQTLVDPNWFYDAVENQAVRILSVANGDMAVPLAPGQAISVTIATMLDGCAMGSVVNWAEISSATDGNGNAVTDIDSTPDDDPNNDPYGDDNQLDGNGTDDEDDQDPEQVQIMDPADVPSDFDLALIKIIVPGQLSGFAAGDDVTFRIQVTNQGDVPADNIEIIDYLPECTTLNDADWTDNMDGTASTTLSVANGGLAGLLTPNQSVTVDITIQLGNCPGGEHINWAEISGATDGAGVPGNDIDSTPDTDQGNDAYDTDNDNTGDGTTDEDDHDPELFVVEEVFDLALSKVVTSTGPFSIGDDVTFGINVFNQGNVIANNIEIVDYTPAGYSFDPAANPGWTEDTDGTLRYTYAMDLDPLTSVEIPLVLTIQPTSGGADDWTNYAEIANATDSDGNPRDDVDSNPDDFPDNDNNVLPGDDNDNIVDEDPTQAGQDDEDDHDPAIVDVFDLAQIKELVTPGPYVYGDVLTYEITVTNQGNVPATNVVITESLPCGLTYLSSNDGSWTYDAASHTAETTITTLINPGFTSVVTIELELTQCLGADDGFENISEISSATDEDGNPQEDSDGDFDDDPNNDTDVTDNEEDGNPNDPNNPDEDNHDPETLPVFDLAQIKTLVTPGPYNYGDLLEFEVTVCNQGNVDAFNIEVTDYIPAGYSFDAASSVGWAFADPDATYAIPFLAADDCITVSLFMTIEMTTGGEEDWINYTEITSADDDTDPTNADPIDADSSPGSDTAGENDVQPDGLGDDDLDSVDPNGNQDDHDPAGIEIFDLAQIKQVITPGPYAYGDMIQYELSVSNQGSIAAYNVEVSDHLPCGLLYADVNDGNGWTYDGSIASTTIPGPIAPGQTMTRVITVQVYDCYDDGAFYNLSEISNADDDTDPNNGGPDDIDSDPDSDPNNDGDPTDDELTGDPNDPNNPDEDDHDPSEIEVFDLALRKLSTFNGVDSIGPFVPGDIVEFHIDVVNQGNVDAYNTVVTDYLNAGFTFVPALNPTWTNTAGVLTHDIDFLAAGETTQLILNLEIYIDENSQFGDWYNEAEISYSEDEQGNNTDDGSLEDADSTPDDDPDNDNDLEDGPDEDLVFNGDDNDNELDENPNDPFGEGDDDEDDNDAAEVLVTGEIGDTVWKDIDGNGVQDPGEQGVEGVIVNLYDCDGNFISSETTDATGYYLFDLLLPGGYQLEFDISQLPLGCDWTYQDQGGDDAADSDVDSDGTTECIDLMAGEMNHDIDAGLIPLAKVGDIVWQDCNGDGIQSPGEAGVPGIQVLLHNEAGVVVSMTYTDENGAYLFDLLYPDNYYLEFVLPFGSNFTLPKLGNNSANDSDVNDSNGQGTTGTFTLSPGECDLDSGDAGIYECVQIGDLVWFDINENDVWDDVENGVNGMRVNLFRQSPDGNFDLYEYTYTGHKPGTASDDGYFKFCVPPGNYYVEFVQPPYGLVPALPNRGNDEEIDSDITGSNGPGTTDVFTVSCTQENCALGAGYYPMGTIGDFVWLDNNQNGMREPGESGIADVLVEAYDVSGAMLGFASTDENGQYNIDYLQATDVYLKFTTPAGYAATLPNMTMEEMDSDIDNSNGPMTTQYYNIVPGSHIPHVDAGLVYGVVPVEWMSFTGQNEGVFNQLDWKVASQINVSHYEVERSINDVSNFSTVGKILSYGTSSEVVDYEYPDYDISQSGTYYYRIKQVDLNGKVDYTEVIAIDIEGSKSEQPRMNVYPNPMVDEFTLEVETFEDGLGIEYTIMDVDGKLVTKRTSLTEAVSAGKHIFLMSAKELTPGVYTMRVTAGSNIVNKKLIVVSN